MKHQNYIIIYDEICPQHGERNFIYQYADENFERIECACEGCTHAHLQERKGEHSPISPVFDKISCICYSTTGQVTR